MPGHIMLTVNYLRVTDCEHDAAKRIEDYKKGCRSTKRKLAMAYLYSNILKKPPMITNITSTDVTFGYAWCTSMVPVPNIAIYKSPAPAEINK